MWKGEPEAPAQRPFEVILRVAIAAALLVGAGFVIGTIFREPLEAAGNQFVSSTGLPGLAVLVFLCDPLPILGFQPGLLLGTTANVHSAPLFAITALSSLAASAMGWWIGRAGANNRVLTRFLATTGASQALAKWGVRAVVLASVTPLPYGMATLAAGAGGMRLPVLLLASTARWLKIAGFLIVYKAAWKLGA